MTLLASVMLLASACTGKQASEKTASGLEPANFRTEVDGKQTDLFVLKNKNGVEEIFRKRSKRLSFLVYFQRCGICSGQVGSCRV